MCGGGSAGIQRGRTKNKGPRCDGWAGGTRWVRGLGGLRKVRNLGGDAWGCRCGAAGAVDDVADFAEAAEGDGDHFVEANVRVGGNFDGTAEDDVGLAKDAVDAESPGFVAGDRVGDFVGCPAVGGGSAGEARLVGRIVGDLGLIEVGAAGVAIPEDLVLLVVFDEEAVDGDVVAVDDEAVLAGVAGPSDAGTVIGAPDPGVVDDGVVAVDFQIDSGAADACAADAEEDIVETDRILCVADGGFVRANLKQDGRGLRACVEQEAGDNDAVGV